jgi:hypothetical protein
MTVEPVAAFKTEDGRLFLTQKEAEEHKVLLNKKAIRKKRHNILWKYLHNNFSSNNIERILDNFDQIRDDFEDEGVMNPD